jgi:3-hydroxyacyl-[acyl-carrier-protein] dehydratase
MAADGLMLQSDPMLLLDELVACGDGAAEGRARIRPGHLFLDGAGRLDAAACVEMLAQLMAALIGYEIKLAGGDIGFGYLVGLKDFSFVAAPRGGDTLRLECRRVFVMEAVSLAEGAIWRGAERLAGGTLKVYEADELPPHPRHPAGGTLKVYEADELPPHPRHPAGAGGVEPICRQTGEKGLDVRGKSPVHRFLIERLSDLTCSSGPERTDAAGEFVLDDAFPGFQGHFPGHPLQPGVVTLEMGLAVAECACGRALEVLTIEQAKFNLPAYPNERIRVETRVGKAENGVRSVAARIKRGGSPIASFSFTAREAAPEGGRF